MLLNPSKCKAMSITRRRNPFLTSYIINNEPIESVKSFKYLGITITNELDWCLHISNIIASANKKLGFFKRHLLKVPPHVRHLAYTSFIRPKLEYASPIWCPYKNYLINALESVQNRAARFIHSAYSYDISISSLKSASNLPSLSRRRRILSLSLFHKFFTVLLPSHHTSRRQHAYHIAQVIV